MGDKVLTIEQMIGSMRTQITGLNKILARLRAIKTHKDDMIAQGIEFPTIKTEITALLGYVDTDLTFALAAMGEIRLLYVPVITPNALTGVPTFTVDVDNSDALGNIHCNDDAYGKPFSVLEVDDIVKISGRAGVADEIRSVKALVGSGSGFTTGTVYNSTVAHNLSGTDGTEENISITVLERAI